MRETILSRGWRVAALAAALGASLAGCASPEAIAARDATMKAEAPRLQLTPEMRAHIATAVAKVVKSGWMTRNEHYQVATISALKPGFVMFGSNAPFYCVGLQSEALLGLPKMSFFRVQARTRDNGDVLFQVSHRAQVMSGMDETLGCGSSKDLATPFPEALAALGTGDSSRPPPAAEPYVIPAPIESQPKAAAAPPPPLRREPLGPG